MEAGFCHPRAGSVPGGRSVAGSAPACVAARVQGPSEDQVALCLRVVEEVDEDRLSR